MDKKPKIHESIYPKLIRLWNESPRKYRNYLGWWGFTRGEQDCIRQDIQDWILKGRELLNREYLNEE